MVNLTIDGRPAQVPEGTTILEAARQADIHIPHLCYLKGINEIAACRVCCVEVEGERAMVTACNNLAGVFTPVMIGSVYDYFGSYSPAFAAMMLISSCCTVGYFILLGKRVEYD